MVFLRKCYCQQQNKLFKEGFYFDKGKFHLGDNLIKDYFASCRRDSKVKVGVTFLRPFISSIVVVFVAVDVVSFLRKSSNLLEMKPSPVTGNADNKSFSYKVFTNSFFSAGAILMVSAVKNPTN